MAVFGMLMLAPLLILLSIISFLVSGLPIFFLQKRVGRYGQPFNIYKFRTMSEAKLGQPLQITTSIDPRITRLGAILRKWKLDELPQLLNILKGEMSFVGPRPEVPKYVNLYPDQFVEILKVRPGLTDLASIKFRNESEMIGMSTNPEEIYVNEILPKKLYLAKKYCEEQSILNDFKIIISTIKAIVIN